MSEMNQYPMPPEPQEQVFKTGRKELRFGIAIVIACLLLADFTLYGGFNLGFALAAAGCIIITAVYLLRSGCKLNWYCGSLLGLSLVLCAAFVRSNDGFVKFVMACFLLTASNLGLCLLAGQNRRSPAGVSSLLDAPRALLALGLGKLGAAFRGLNAVRKEMSATGKNRSAVLVGIAIAVPVMAVLIALLVSADAAFEGLLDLLPEIDLTEPFLAIIFGCCAACVLYTRGVALLQSEKDQQAQSRRKGVNPLTVNTVLIAVCVVYGVYLFSQLAYFFGGFLGLLPAEYTMAEYARRGFFEMCWLCAINLAIMTTAVALAGRENRATKVLCLIVGIMTLFFVAAASAKMFLYIGSYGLTRLRLLTEVIMVFLGITTALVCVWLFAPKFAYMKAVLLVALVMGAAVSWVDVDTVVARHNVRAYQSGQLNSVDIHYLGRLSAGAVPYLQELAQDGDKVAVWLLEAVMDDPWDGDWRSFTIAGAIADNILESYRSDQDEDTTQ